MPSARRGQQPFETFQGRPQVLGNPSSPEIRVFFSKLEPVPGFLNSPLNNEHRVAVAIEAVAFDDGLFIRAADQVVAAEGARENQKC